ncbi:valine--tRNA ligase [Candidatus Dependentiae bacterium]|nr:valine--tRNA ligase [Candidatus Dependentiae bacterium]
MDKQYNHQTSELEAQKLWEQENTYSCSNNPGPIYSIDTPPPTVSGSLHIGHIFSYTQTDIIARYKRMSGYSVFYPFGFDDNGLPTERFVEKKNNIVAHNMSRSAFIELCLKETVAVEEQFKKLWQRMGLSVDWSLSYATIDKRTRIISQLSCIDLFNKGFLYRKDEPALYCTTCRTSVAQAELDDAQKPGKFNEILFKTADGKDLKIATTRPELLPSCVALLYNPKDSRYKDLKGQEAIVPIFGHKVPILQDESVEIEKGTGLVMVCTFGDKMDVEWFKKFKLPYRQSIGLDGKFKQDIPHLSSLKVEPAREKILELLKEAGLLLKQTDIMHSVNIHERCKKEIEYVVLPQWFIKILPYKDKFLELGDKINWYPEFMKDRYKNWVENLNWDWGISRQRFYGIPFPAWHCKDCNTTIMADKNMLPVDPQETPYNKPCPKCNGKNIVPDTDVMDTWNTSALTPFICLSLYGQDPLAMFDQKPKDSFIPMSMRPQAHDIIRTWAFYTIAKTWMHQETIPWKNIIISGHVLSTEKQKISKSQGNAPLDPDNLLKTYPADALRYWTASGNLGYDISFSDSQIKIGQKLIVKLWNAFKFAHMYLENYSSKNEKISGTVNEWILHRISQCFENYKKYFEQNEFGLALDTIEKFFWADYCDNYIEIIKDQLMNPQNYTEQEVNSTKETLYQVGLRILQMYAPYVPHITESLYNNLYKKNIGTISLHQTRFVDIQKIVLNEKAVEKMSLILYVVHEVRRLKTEKQLSLRTDIEDLDIYSPDEISFEVFKNEMAIIKGITKAKNIHYFGKDISQSVLQEIEPGKYKAQIKFVQIKLEK